MKRPKIIIIHGFIGAGKTTFSKALEKETGYLRLNGDEYCMSHFMSNELEKNWEKCFSKAINNLWEKTAHEISLGRSIILDFGFWSYESRQDAREKAQILNADFEHFYISANNQTLKNRIKKRGGAIAQKNLDNFDEFMKSFEKPKANEIHKIILTD